MRALILCAVLATAACQQATATSEADRAWEANQHAYAIKSYMELGLTRPEAEAHYKAFKDGSLYSAEEKAAARYHQEQRDKETHAVACAGQPWLSGC